MNDDSKALSMSIRAKVNNIARRLDIAPQAALQAYFAERFLVRLSLSRHASAMVVKGGTLMSSLFGIAERTTMDIDATLIGVPGDETNIRSILAEICGIDAKDGISFVINCSGPIRKDDEYGGYGFSLTAHMGTIRLPLGVDVTVGDVITPSPAFIEHSSILDQSDRICLFAYTTETLLAEKLQTVLKRGTLTTRPRDFYDIHKIVASGMYRPDILVVAVRKTFERRNSDDLIPQRYQILESIERSMFIREMWRKYRERFSYAKDIELKSVFFSIRKLLDLL